MFLKNFKLKSIVIEQKNTYDVSNNYVFNQFPTLSHHYCCKLNLENIFKMKESWKYIN